MENYLVDIAVRCPCNYHCSYCVGGNQKEKTNNINLEKIDSLFKNLNAFVGITLECGCSEPTLHPQLKELIEVCTNYGSVSIPTNNSIDPRKWLPEDPLKASRVSVIAALHESGEEKLDEFTRNVKYLQQKGVTVTVTYVAHPNRIKSNALEKYTEYFNKMNIIFKPVSFKGEYESKEYPDAYSDLEKEKLNLDNWYTKLECDMKVRDWSGIPCYAGSKCFYINEYGEIQRCIYDKKIIGNVQQEAKPCEVYYCGCGLKLRELNFIDDLINSYRNISGLNCIKTEKMSDEKRYLESKEKYLELMNMYGKTQDRYSNINKYKGDWNIINRKFFEICMCKEELNVAIFGAGSGGKLTYSLIEAFNKIYNLKIKVKVFIDNNTKKLGTKCYKIDIINPNEEILKGMDYIIIASDWKKDITYQLMNLGVDRKKILYSY